MRIVMGVPFLFPALSYGGAARAVYELARALCRLGEEVIILTTDVWDAGSRFPGDLPEPPFEVVRIPNLSNLAAYHLQFYTPLGVRDHARRALKGADIVHLHTFRNLLNESLCREASSREIPYVLSGHGTIPRIERFRGIKRLYDALLGDWQLKHAARFVAVSPAERRRLRARGIRPELIRTVPNGCELAEPPSPGAFRRRWEIPGDEHLILYLGKLTPRKGVQHLVRAVHRLRGAAVRLVIAGNDMGYGCRIRQLVSALRLESQVLWTGLLDDQRKREALVDADVTVIPSRREVFGLVALESLWAGTPVVVCDDDGCAEIVRRIGGGRIVPWGDPGALADAIRRQLESGKNPAELEASRERIAMAYSWPLAARRTIRVYQEVLRNTFLPVRVSAQ